MPVVTPLIEPDPLCAKNYSFHECCTANGSGNICCTRRLLREDANLAQA
jgi:hypothetical protein